jgi:hypothetical protein
VATRSTDDERAAVALPRALALKGSSNWATSNARLGALLPGAPPLPARNQWLLDHLADAAHVESTVRALPVACLVVLSQCLDREGAVEAQGLTAIFGQWEAPATLVRASFEHLVGQGLGWWPAHNPHLFFAFREPLWAARALLRGLVDPAHAYPADLRGRGPGRDLAATLALTTHRSMRTTNEGGLNRTKLKGFVKGNGLVPEEVEHRLEVGRRLGLLLEDKDGDLHVETSIARPFLAREGRAVLHPLYTFFGAGWFRESDVHGPGDPASFLRATGETVTHEGRLVARAGSLVRPDGDGHVTPSFEVLLGPEADASLTLVVGMVAELSRADHVLTHRLTPSSVARGLAAGLSIEVVRAELERVSKRPLPETVSALLDDAARRNLRARTVVAIEGHASALDAMAAQLGARALGRPSRECLLVEGDVEPVALSSLASKGAAALDVSGVRGLASTTPMFGLAELRAQAREQERQAREAAFAPLETRKPDPALRARFEQALVQRFAEDAKRLLGSPARDEPAVSAAPRQRSLDVAPAARASVSSPIVTDGPPRPQTPEQAIRSWQDAADEAQAAGRVVEARYFGLLARAAAEVKDEVVAWAASIGDPSAATRVLDDHDLASFAFLAPHWRRKALHTTLDADDLISVAVLLDAPNAQSALGRKGYLELRALGEAPPRPGREDDDDDDDDDDDGPEILEVIEGPPTERVAKKLVQDVIANEVALRVIERSGGAERTYVLYPDAVRARGQQQVIVGEGEDGASRVVVLGDIVRLEVIAQ